MITIPADTTTRTWHASLLVTLDGAVLATLTHTITAHRRAGRIVATFVDGVEASIERAAHLLRWAQRPGCTLTMVETTETETEALREPAVIGRKVAAVLHRDLARLGITRHYQVAQEVLGAPVTTLAALTAEEAQTVWGYACSLVDLAPQPSIVYGVAL